MSLTRIYKKVTRECYLDDRGVYTPDGKKVALSNEGGEAYIRYDDGPITTEKITPTDYRVITPYVLVGAMRCVSAAELARATVSALATCNADITEITTSKQAIGESEGIDLSKFTDVTLVRISYTVEEHKAYDHACIYSDSGTAIDSGCGEARVKVNGTQTWEVLCEGSLNILLKNELGETITPVGITGNTITIDDTGGECQDADWTLKDTAGATLNTGSIASGASADITAPDATANLRNTDGTAISTTALKSGESKSITAPDAEAVLKDSAGNVLDTEQIPSNTSEDITAPDATVTLNSGAFLTPASGATVDIILQDQDSNPITPDSVVGSTITVTVGCEVADVTDLVDFTTLNWTNPFGNSNRFTDTLGGQTYANDLVVDWTTWNQCNETVEVYYRVLDVNNYTNAQAFFAALTIGSFNDFNVADIMQVQRLVHPDQVTRLDYAPFNIAYASASDELRGYYFTAGNNLCLGSTSGWNFRSDGTSRSNLGVMKAPLSLMGL